MLSFLKKSPRTLQTCSDTILVQKSIAGNNLAFEALVIRYQKLIYTIALSGCGNFALSEDITQDTFIQAWKKIDTLKDPELFKSWLCTITRRITSRLQSKQTVVDDTATPELIDGAKTPAQNSTSSDDIALVQQTIAKLPDLYREPLVLHYSQHLSVKEIAAILEVSEDAVKQRLARGRKHLKANIENTIENVLLVSQPSSAVATTVSAAILSTQSQSAAATIATSTSLLKTVSGVGLFGFIASLVLKIGLDSTRSPAERKLYLRHIKINVLIMITFLTLTLGPAIYHLYFHVNYHVSPYILSFAFLAPVIIMIRHHRFHKMVQNLRDHEQTNYPPFGLISPLANAPLKRACVFGLIVTVLLTPTALMSIIGEHWTVLCSILLATLLASIVGYTLGKRPDPKKETFITQWLISTAGICGIVCSHYYPPMEATLTTFFSNGIFMVGSPPAATILLAMLSLAFINLRTEVAAKQQAYHRTGKDNE